MKIIFASQNKNKLHEIQSRLLDHEIIGLDEKLFPDELAETGNTLNENAFQKAQQVWDKLGISCFADDTGLEVEALEGKPGVYSARYAGEHKSSEDNMDLLLYNMRNISDRRASFRTCISLCVDNTYYFFEGICSGEIAREKRGGQGFGYDPIFVPSGFDRTFAEMTIAEKSSISHRGLAIDKLVQFLKTKAT